MTRETDKKPAPTKDMIQGYFLAGASIYQVCNTFGITSEYAQSLQDEITEEVKKEIANSKVLIRARLRSSVPAALEYISKVISPPKGSELASDLGTIQGRAKINLQLRAAQLVLAASKDVLGENILTMLAERPQVQQLQQTLFDFSSEIDERGGMTLIASPRKELLEEPEYETRDT